MSSDEQKGLRFLSALITRTPLGYVSCSLSKPYFVEGELVQGAVFCDFLTPVMVKSIEVKVKGYEKVEWHKKDSRSETIPGTNPPQTKSIPQLKKKRAKKVILKQKINVPVPQGTQNLIGTLVQPGQHTMPFNFQLPAQCPSTFYERQLLTAQDIPRDCEFVDKEGGIMASLKGENEDFDDSDDEEPRNARCKMLAVVNYKISVTVDLVNMPGIDDLYCRVPLIVHPKLDVNIQPAFQEVTKDVIVCCCFNKGPCYISQQFDKTAYVAGETCNVVADIKNDSTKDLKTKVILRRKFFIKATCGEQDFTEDIITMEQPIVAGKTALTKQPMPLQLTGDKIKPTTKGVFINCSYDYLVFCGVSWGKDIELKMPVTIYVPQPPPNPLIPLYNPAPVVLGQKDVTLGFAGMSVTVDLVGDSKMEMNKPGAVVGIGPAQITPLMVEATS